MQKNNYTKEPNALDSYLINDSALMSCIKEEEETFHPSQDLKLSELLSELELINEDRRRLLKENESLQFLKSQILLKNLQIEFLSKVATKSLEKQCQCKKKPDIPATPLKSRAIRIASPSDQSSNKDSSTSTSGFSKLPRHDFSHSPMSQHRYTSSKIRVSRNYPKASK